MHDFLPSIKMMKWRKEKLQERAMRTTKSCLFGEIRGTCLFGQTACVYPLYSPKSYRTMALKFFSRTLDSFGNCIKAMELFFPEKYTYYTLNVCIQFLGAWPFKVHFGVCSVHGFRLEILITNVT